MPSITYRTDDETLSRIRQNAAVAGLSVPKYLDYFMGFAASLHGKKQHAAAAAKKPRAKSVQQMRKGGRV